jgi:hypothetical protein
VGVTYCGGGVGFAMLLGGGVEVVPFGFVPGAAFGFVEDGFVEFGVAPGALPGEVGVISGFVLGTVLGVEFGDMFGLVPGVWFGFGAASGVVSGGIVLLGLLAVPLGLVAEPGVVLRDPFWAVGLCDMVPVLDCPVLLADCPVLLPAPVPVWANIQQLHRNSMATTRRNLCFIGSFHPASLKFEMAVVSMMGRARRGDAHPGLNYERRV